MARKASRPGCLNTLDNRKSGGAGCDPAGQEHGIARALIAARAQADMTQSEVARAMGVTQPVVARMESGCNVSVKALRRYARAVRRPIPIVIQPSPEP